MRNLKLDGKMIKIWDFMDLMDLRWIGPNLNPGIDLGMGILQDFGKI